VKAGGVAAFFLATLLATSVPAASPDFAAMQVQSYDPPKPAPALALPDLNGKTVHLEEHRGKVVILVFWATW
jgi:cytochrome oxidase Cu insertion factor (SCO1/SenC/PrrC family)